VSFQEQAVELTGLNDEQLIHRLYVGVYALDAAEGQERDERREKLVGAVREGVERWAPRETVVAEMRREYVEFNGEANVDEEMAGLLEAVEERARLR